MASASELIVILGPTASGKTALSLKLAKAHQADIFSADSRQFYKELNIGVAKPSQQELLQAKHHFINSISIHDEYSAGTYEKDALSKLTEYFKTNQTAILVGGSGLFIKALTHGLDYFPEIKPQIREKLSAQMEKEGLEVLVAQLKNLDPQAADSIALDNPRRVIRALEVCLSSGKPYSAFKLQSKKERPFAIRYLGINWPREVLYQRINQRCDEMLEMGLLDEVKRVYPYKHLNACQTVGYQEFFDYLDGKLNLAEAIEKFKQHTRNYAKRQITWFNKIEGVEWLDGENL